MQKFDWHWQTRDGLQLYARAFTPEMPHAVVVLIHGHGEHSGRYLHVADAFCSAGYALATFDLRGHGLSDGQRGHCASYDALMDDIGDFLTQTEHRFVGLPVFLYGHSLGGNLVTNFVLRRESSVSGVLVTGPWFRLAFEPPAAKITLGQMMDQISPAFTQPSGLDVSGISREGNVVNAYTGDPLVHSKITARSFIAFYNAGLWVLEHAAKLKIPMLLMHGTADRLTSPSATQDFARKAGELVTLRLWEGLFHEIHNEPEQGQVIQSMIAWMDEHLT
ncbi:MAG: lysophospholipase [Chloroflexi bacterium HGW-Chloroflexi-6]|nr:MAG: lysophospholipase [Chloroflexi bacterium HGW-Chloroflexi-6]